MQLKLSLIFLFLPSSLFAGTIDRKGMADYCTRLP
jgi:hypothetical protein